MIQFYNDAYRPSLGNSGKHPLALGQKAIDCWPEIWDIIYPLIQQVQTTGQATWSEDQLIPIFRNGKIEDVYWTFGYSPIIGESEKIEGVLVVCTETTEKVQSRKAVEESERSIRNIILQAPVAMCILRGPSYTVEIANKKMFELWEKEEHEVINKPIFEGLPEAKEQGLEQVLLKTFTTGETFVANERPVILPRNGKSGTVYLNFVYEALRQVDGSVSGILALAIDVTEGAIARQKIEEIVAARTKELADANNDLQKSNSELAQFAYIASHDLQEPLRKISVFSQMLENNLGSKIDEQSKNYLDKIRNSSSRMNKLIRDVLTYSELAKENQDFTEVDLRSIIENIKTDYELLIEQTEARIEYGNLPTIEAIPLQMSQLFSNLIGNSLKFARKDVTPVITIQATRLSKEEQQDLSLFRNLRYYKIRISDNGIGFNVEHADQIFSIFQRLHRKSEYAGTGIGLSMCKKIALNHHGDINAAGSSENGAVFNVILPVKK